MKIAITGHSKGIGKGLYDYYATTDQVYGFSRSNGFDITVDKDKIIDEIKDFDIFINNAQSQNHQIGLFNKLYNIWKNQEKTIVNIGSKAKYLANFDNVTRSEYDQAKINLSTSALNKMFQPERKCRIINVNPGLVYTDLVKHLEKNHKMLTVEETVNIIVHAINLPFHIEVGEISFWRTF